MVEEGDMVRESDMIEEGDVEEGDMIEKFDVRCLCQTETRPSGRRDVKG